MITQPWNQRNAFSATAFLACVVAANVTTSRFGMVHFAGLSVTAGTFVAGASFVARDAVAGPLVPWLILAGSALSAILGDAGIAFASAIAFAASESIDWAVFASLRKNLAVAVAVSGAVAGVADTLIFLAVAGFPVTVSTVAGQVVVKAAMSATAGAALWAWRR